MDTRFDSRDAGTPERAWATSWLESLSSLAAPRAADRIVVVAAHPDDETLGAGGLIATAAAAGAHVTIVIASDGEGSHPNSPTHSPHQLREIRRAEVNAAVAQLHPQAELHFLGLPDSALTGCATELTSAITRYSESASLLVTPWTGDRHPDHAACADAGARVAQTAGIEHWQFPIWAWHWGTPLSLELPRAQLLRLCLDDTAISAKNQALAAHVSQHTALSSASGDEAVLNASMLEHFQRPSEVFVVARSAPATDGKYFDDLYAEQHDPWGLADRFYERRKRDLLVASLPREHFRRAFEPGCATGLLTVELARRCDDVVAWDGAHIAVEQTSARMTAAAYDRVVVERARIPDRWPAGRFDLIVLSEIGYYCVDQVTLRNRIDDSLGDEGVLVACHWRHPAPDHATTAEVVHVSLGRGLHHIVSHHEADFLLDVWSRDPASVAAGEGILQ